MKTEWRNRRVGVLMGGLSAEREVSLDTGRGVLAGLRERGYECVGIEWASDTSLPAQLAAAEVAVVWNALHGTLGEDGAVQGLLACMGIACTGSGILASSLAMDKVASKRIFESHGLPTPAWACIPVDADPVALLQDWQTPVVIKPANEGSSVGVTIVRDRAALSEAVALARSYHGPTLVETYIAGAEIHVGVLDDAVLGAIEVKVKVGFYDYEAKYRRDDTEYIIPATVEESAQRRCEALALDAYRALGCAGYARVDLRVGPPGMPYLLEVNTLPGMTSHSLLPKIAAHAGIDYPELCERILALAKLPPR